MKKVASVDVYEIPGHGMVLMDLRGIAGTAWRWAILPISPPGWSIAKFNDTADLERFDKVSMYQAAAKVARAVDAKKARVS